MLGLICELLHIGGKEGGGGTGGGYDRQTDSAFFWATRNSVNCLKPKDLNPKHYGLG